MPLPHGPLRWRSLRGGSALQLSLWEETLVKQLVLRRLNGRRSGMAYRCRLLHMLPV